ncbi:MAG: hypothetical protein A4E64_02957 [Syntrophorhabdus sp. PtaU1.Bin058]|nr:MAG: hypothetical protein A4E64_02957 [Syntrophorhabdus sp. PtaU1.Bin058]
MNVESLNKSQQRHLLASFKHVDKLLTDIEQILNASSSNSPFPEYRLDVTPAQIKVIQDYIARIRAEILRVLEIWAIPAAKGPPVSAIHSIRVHLAFARVALVEASPDYIRGYGDIQESTVVDLNCLINGLNVFIDKLNGYLAEIQDKAAEGNNG